MRSFKKIKSIFLVCCSIFLCSSAFANSSITIGDWLISFEDSTCWASALIVEDHHKEYDPENDFQYTISFHNGVHHLNLRLYRILLVKLYQQHLLNLVMIYLIIKSLKILHSHIQIMTAKFYLICWMVLLLRL